MAFSILPDSAGLGEKNGGKEDSRKVDRYGIASQNLKTVPFVYKPDRYSKQFIKIPPHASAVVINGGLDFQTVREWRYAEFENLGGHGDKVLIELENVGHCSGLGATTCSDPTKYDIKVIASYVLKGGRVDKLGATCMSNLLNFSFADLRAIQQVIKVELADELCDPKA